MADDDTTEVDMADAGVPNEAAIEEEHMMYGHGMFTTTFGSAQGRLIPS